MLLGRNDNKLKLALGRPVLHHLILQLTQRTPAALGCGDKATSQGLAGLAAGPTHMAAKASRESPQLAVRDLIDLMMDEGRLCFADGAKSP